MENASRNRTTTFQNGATSVFACRECFGEIPATPPVKEALLNEGCAICGSPVTLEEFDAS